MKATLVLLLVMCAAGWSLGKNTDEPWERQPASRAIEPQEKDTPKESTALGSAIDFLLSAYRFLLSDQQGEICAFLPSCSNYSQQAFDFHGPILGLIVTIDRLERCNWSAWNYAGRYYPIVSRDGRMMLSDSVRTSSRDGDIQ